jgi:cytochrome c-type biogenesis protein
MPEVSLISALIGGILTFLAPCTLPLIPAYIAFISGAGNARGRPPARATLVLLAVVFCLGFSVVFVGYGVASGALGQFLVLHRALLAQIGGIFIILFGLGMLGLFKLPKFFGGSGKPPRFIAPGTIHGSFLLGLLFALGWSPCFGPILGAIILLAGTSGTALWGGFLLSVYALGLAIPFIAIAYFYGSAFSWVSVLSRFLKFINIAGALLLIAIGVLLLLGRFGELNGVGQQFLPINYEAFMNYM